MSIGFLLYVALVVTLVGALAWAAEALCRQLGRPARWAWLGASIVAIALVLRAVMVTSADHVATTYERIALPEASRVAAPEWSLLHAVRDIVTMTLTTIGSLTDAIIRVMPHAATTVGIIAWIVTSLIALVVLALVHLRIRRARREWAETELFGTHVRIAPDVGPAVVGLARPQIVVPLWLLGRSSDEQQLVLAHEREHLRARDHLLLGAVSLVVALVPWHPAAWWMLARLRLAIELDCDARVLRNGVPARTYGTLLIDLADRCTGFRVGATALADEGSHLERRLLAMKTTKSKRSYVRTGLFGSAAALALLAACEAKVPTGPEIEAMDVASASKAVVGTRLMQKERLDSAIFYVDGKLVDAKTANTLTPNQIATIDISKGGSYPVIRIATNGQAADVAARSDGALLRTKRLADKVQGTAIAPQGTKDFTGLLIIDGVKSEPSAMAALDRSKIESVEVLKGAAAERLYTDPLAKNGVIVITTKK